MSILSRSRPKDRRFTQKRDPASTALSSSLTAAPSSTASDDSWLNAVEPNRDDHDRGVVHVREAAQVSERLAPRLRTPEAEAAWTAATSSEYLHRVRRHGLEVPLTNGM